MAQKGYDRASALVQTGTITQTAFGDAEFKHRAGEDQLATAQARHDLEVADATTVSQGAEL